MQARLIGFAFEEEGTSSLFRATWLPIGPGLNVLYGLNGAGKTTVLSSVRSALAGERVKRGGKPAQGCLPHFAVADPGPRNANWEEFTGYIRSLSDLFGADYSAGLNDDPLLSRKPCPVERGRFIWRLNSRSARQSGTS